MPALAVAALAVWGLGTGCRRNPDRLYALELERAPSEADWAGAVPLRVEATGGRTSQKAESDVDSDAVHTATASCHHGTGSPSIPLDLRAFYTPERLYLRVEWADPTVNEGPSWRWNGRAWTAGPREGSDGLAFLWGWGEPGGFSCSHLCHLQDWRMEETQGLADFAMRGRAGQPPVDVWLWRAGRGRAGGMVEDLGLGPEGFRGDAPGALFAPNSLRAGSGRPNPFDEGDAPSEAPVPTPGGTAPGSVLLAAPAGRTEVDGAATRGTGTWRLTLSRALRGADAGDAEFRPSAEATFGVSVFDGVARDHNAVAKPVRLVLVGRDTIAALRRRGWE